MTTNTNQVYCSGCGNRIDDNTVKFAKSLSNIYSGIFAKVDAGGDYVDMGGNDLFNFGTGDFTLEHWYKSDLTSGHFCNSMLKYGGTSYYYDITINADGSGYPQFHFLNGDGSNHNAVGNIRVDDNQWHCLSGVREGNTIKLYIDGIL